MKNAYFVYKNQWDDNPRWNVYEMNIILETDDFVYFRYVNEAKINRTPAIEFTAKQRTFYNVLDACILADALNSKS